MREKHGLSYYQYSSFSAARGPASWTLHIGVNPKRLGFAIDVLKAEIERLQTEPVPTDELQSMIAFLEGSQALRLESGDNVASFLEQMARHKLGFDYLQRYPQMIAGLTQKQLQNVATKYLNLDALTVVTAGPELEG